MSDRTRASVRTDSREVDSAADGVPQDADPAGDGSRPAGGATAAGQPPADSTQVITPSSPPSGVFAAQPGPGPAFDNPLRSPASSPAPSVGRTELGVPGSPAGAAPGGRPTAARSQSTAAPVGLQETQAVKMPPVAGRPTGASGRPPMGAPASGPAEPRERGGRGRSAGRGPRRARLQLRHIDPWTALKISLAVSIALFFVWMVAIGILYGVLNGLGVFQTLNDLIGQLGSASGGSAHGNVISAGVVFGSAAVIGAVNVVLLTALCTVGTVIYNLCSDLVGGVEVTLAERE